jgi:hypothetical protein
MRTVHCPPRWLVTELVRHDDSALADALVDMPFYDSSPSTSNTITIEDEVRPTWLSPN